MDHVIILAAGDEKRWNNYLGVRKHFIEIEGEKIIHRAVRLVRRYGENRFGIYVVGLDNEYAIDGTKLYVPNKNPNHFDADKYLNSRSLWNENGRTIVLLGDVWFSDEAMVRIIDYQNKNWCVFGRKGASMLTGCPHEEIFAQSFYPEHIEKHYSKLSCAVELYRKGLTKTTSGWLHYRLMSDMPFEKSQINGNFIEIDDFTDDFDLPQDYDNWIKNREYFKSGHIKRLQMKILHRARRFTDSYTVPLIPLPLKPLLRPLYYLVFEKKKRS